jgi:peptidoglycan lytic transglycosylase A
MLQKTPTLQVKTALGYLLLASLCILLLQACPPRHPAAPEPGAASMVRLRLAQYPDFRDDMNYDGLSHAIERSLAYLETLPSGQVFTFGKDHFSAAHLISSLSHFHSLIGNTPPSVVLNDVIRRDYIVYQSVGEDPPGQVLFTGYYEPILHGSLHGSDRYPYPVYARPQDLATIDLSLFSPAYKGKTLVGRIQDHTLVPYFNRAAIENGSLEGRAAPLAWVNDRVDLFFLQIQGSGKIYLDTGGVLNVHYQISNGKPYRSIGKLLIDEGKVPRSEMSMQRIRAYLEAHPEEIDRVLSYNPSYVFFKLEPDGPLGCLGVQLTPGRSLALDRRIFPLAGLSFIRTQEPLVSGDGTVEAWGPCTRFVLNQDTGGAIRGPGRADLFWGNGQYAAVAAGYMQQPGTLYFLVLKPTPSG